MLLRTAPGGLATVRLRRRQHAERLFRLTGGGLYRDTLMTGGTAPVAEPLLSAAGVLGQDSLVAAAYRGRIYWFFGDTECPAGPRDTDCQHYGRFTNGATSPAGRLTAASIHGVYQSMPINPPLPPQAGGPTPPSLEYFVSADPAAPGGMAADGLPSKALIAAWNPRGGSLDWRLPLPSPSWLVPSAPRLCPAPTP